MNHNPAKLGFVAAGSSASSVAEGNSNMKLVVCKARSAMGCGVFSHRAASSCAGRRGGATFCLLLVTCAVFVQTLRAGTAVDFRQAANNDGGFGLGNTHWISSVIQGGNS